MEHATALEEADLGRAIVEQEEALRLVAQGLTSCPDDVELLKAKKELEASLAECREALGATHDESGLAARCTAPQPSHRRERRNWRNNNPDIHPLSRYALHEPDFEALSEKQAYLKPFLQALVPVAIPPAQPVERSRRRTVDFSDPAACIALTRALLQEDFGVVWFLPPGRLCPPLTNRLNYILWISDLLGLATNSGCVASSCIRGLDIGCGANLIYCLLGAAAQGWAMVGVDVDEVALESAAALIEANPRLGDKLLVRHAEPQPEQKEGETASKIASPVSPTLHSAATEDEKALRLHPSRLGRGILSGAMGKDDPVYSFTMCNPPFFAEAAGVGANPNTDYGGSSSETVYPGGEEAFVLAMVLDSQTVPKAAIWFTTMVGKKSTLVLAQKRLRTLQGVRCVRTRHLAQGRTSRWALAWSFVLWPEVGMAALKSGQRDRSAEEGSIEWSLEVELARPEQSAELAQAVAEGVKGVAGEVLSSTATADGSVIVSDSAEVLGRVVFMAAGRREFLVKGSLCNAGGASQKAARLWNDLGQNVLAALERRWKARRLGESKRLRLAR